MLTALEDLSLGSNRITELEGLESNLALQCLSLGNNQIRALQDTVMYLRRFVRLRLVNLKGNPVERDADYRTIFLAYLKHVVFLDFAMIEGSEVRAAGRAGAVQRGGATAAGAIGNARPPAPTRTRGHFSAFLV